MNDNESCYNCGDNCGENTNIYKCSYMKQKYECSKCGHSEMEHDHFVCENCGDLCDNCQEWFCSASNRKHNMHVCDECALYNG